MSTPLRQKSILIMGKLKKILNIFRRLHFFKKDYEASIKKKLFHFLTLSDLYKFETV